MLHLNLDQETEAHIQEIIANEKITCEELIQRLIAEYRSHLSISSALNKRDEWSKKWQECLNNSGYNSPEKVVNLVQEVKQEIANELYGS